MTMDKDTSFRYYLKHRQSGYEISLGYSPLLTKEIIEEYNLNKFDWELQWQLLARSTEDEKEHLIHLPKITDVEEWE